jgi:hypothetical protein
MLFFILQMFTFVTIEFEYSLFFMFSQDKGPNRAIKFVLEVNC